MIIDVLTHTHTNTHLFALLLIFVIKVVAYADEFSSAVNSQRVNGVDTNIFDYQSGDDLEVKFGYMITNTGNNTKYYTVEIKYYDYNCECFETEFEIVSVSANQSVVTTITADAVAPNQSSSTYFWAELRIIENNVEVHWDAGVGFYDQP
jgi:hypothetical protein